MSTKTKPRLNQGHIHADPICFWCPAKIGIKVEYVGLDPTLGLPAGVGVRVCTPACPERPDTAIVIRRGQEGL